MTIEDPDAEAEQRFVTLGMDALGRILVVSSTPRGSRIRLISARKASKGKRGPVIASPEKKRVTILIDEDVIGYFREKAERQGSGHQTMINQALRALLKEDGSGQEAKPLTLPSLRKVLREELRAA